MSASVPRYVDPWLMASQSRQVEGCVSLAGMDRLAQTILNQEGQVQVSLNFQRRGSLTVISGKVVAELELICQRCLKPMNIQVQKDVNLAAVRGEQEAERLPEDLEPVLLEGDELLIPELVEDELILALPHVATHTGQACEMELLPETKGEQEPVLVVEGKPNPFASLKDLKLNV